MNIKKESGIKVGLFGIGLDTYWPQFEGLLERLVVGALNTYLQKKI